MTPDDYVELAVKTESPINSELLARLTASARAVHAMMGMPTEVGELIDAFKKYIFYGRMYDRVNVAEEVGDLLWYVALICDHCELSLEAIMKINIEKLQRRYPERYTHDKALNRDLDAERKTLEGEQ